MSLYLTPQTAPMRAMLEFDGISTSAKCLLMWLLFATNPSSGVVEGATVSAVADELSWKRDTVRRALDELRNGAGMIDFELPNGDHRGGWVRVLAFYDIMQMTKWLAKQRAIANA